MEESELFNVQAGLREECVKFQWSFNFYIDGEMKELIGRGGSPRTSGTGNLWKAKQILLEDVNGPVADSIKKLKRLVYKFGKEETEDKFGEEYPASEGQTALKSKTGHLGLIVYANGETK